MAVARDGVLPRGVGVARSVAMVSSLAPDELVRLGERIIDGILPLTGLDLQPQPVVPVPVGGGGDLDHAAGEPVPVPPDVQAAKHRTGSDKDRESLVIRPEDRALAVRGDEGDRRQCPEGGAPKHCAAGDRNALPRAEGIATAQGPFRAPSHDGSCHQPHDRQRADRGEDRHLAGFGRRGGPVRKYPRPESETSVSDGIQQAPLPAAVVGRWGGALGGRAPRPSEGNADHEHSRNRGAVGG